MPDNQGSRMEGNFSESNPDRFQEEGRVSQLLDPLALEIEDDELADIIDRRIREIRLYNKTKLNLYERRKKMEMHRFGRQVMQKEKERLLKDYESHYEDNVLYEIAMTMKPVAMSRLPDLLVTPGNDNEDSRLVAQEISKAVDTEIKEKDNRQVLGLAFEHRPVYLISCIKTRWDPEIDDYIFEVIHPDNMDIDHTSHDANSDHMEIVSQLIPSTVEEMILRFPDKKEKLMAELQKDGIVQKKQNTWSQMATTVKYRETWFTQYKRKADDKVERIEGVCWKYGSVILKKMKNPNFDYEGETRYFSYEDMDNPATKKPLDINDLKAILGAGQLPPNVQQEQVYHNYFRVPRKPFFFMTYDRWGKQPMDETSWLEQVMQIQKSIDKRGKQLEETLDQRGHHVFSKESGLTAADVEELDMNDPDEDLVVDGDVNKTHKYIEPSRPTPQEFKEMDVLHQRAYDISGSNSIRGEVKSDTTATTNQIAREANFTRADDLVEDTINAAAEWMAEWALQWIKLRYTKDHFRELLGVAGTVVYQRLNRNMISDGMIVKIKASGTDKLRAQNNAMDMAKMEMIDPYQFYVDMGLSDPEGRTEKIILWKQDPISYAQKVLKNVNTSEALAQALMQQQVEPPTLPQPPTPPGGAPIAPGQPPMPPGQPQQPTPTNTAAVPIAPPTGPPQASPRTL